MISHPVGDTSHDHSLPVGESDLGRYLTMAEDIAAMRSESVNALSIEITTMPSSVEELRDFIMPVASVYQSTELVQVASRHTQDEILLGFEASNSLVLQQRLL